MAASVFHWSSIQALSLCAMTVLHCDRAVQGGPICNTVTTVIYCSLLYSPIQYLSVLQMIYCLIWDNLLVQFCFHAFAMQSPIALICFFERK